ncbi:glycosyltransferase family 2 protein [Pontibacter chitinilyticus]|uniref:glycosyltransferase family 2 protein n=1 Tax=Pontibacter chitinilyticus TaxID=2674989 RepID=UPI003219A196
MPRLVSVIIPCFNGEHFVGRAINSALSQSYKDIELLLVDNNSTDNTFAVLKEFEKSHPDKITVYSEKKKGACAARNLGLSMAKGDWIQFLDADDELLPLKIEQQMAVVESKNPDIVIGDYTIFHSVTQKRYADRIAEDDPWLGLINSKLGRTSANIWRKESLLKVNGWNEELSSSQEYDLMFRVFKLNAKVEITHQIQTSIFAQPDSITKTDNLEKRLKIYLNRYNLRRDIYEFLREHNQLTPVYKKNILVYLYYYLLLISELDMPFFKAHVKRYDFNEINALTKFDMLIKFIRHSSKRKYGLSNIFLKLTEWQVFVFKNIHLLRY